MNQFRENVENYFAFLNNYEYKISGKSDINSVIFIGKDNQLDISFSTIGYELNCQFVNAKNETFYLQDGLNYMSMSETKGLYQIADKEDIDKGISYLAEAVKSLFQRIDISDNVNFQKIYQFRINMHEKLLKQYYYETDIKNAKKYWGNREYAKAKELFEKHVDCLSKSQLKKLEYIKKHL